VFEPPFGRLIKRVQHHPTMAKLSLTWRMNEARCALEPGPAPGLNRSNPNGASIGSTGENKMLKEFKEFAIKGNMVDMAVGIIIGAAFGAIVSSLVDDVFMPVIGLFLGGLDFSNFFIVLGKGSFATIAQAKEAGVSTLNIGLFINAVIKFIIIAFALFIVIKAINIAKKKVEDTPSEPAAPPAQEVLLTEIRDLLKR